MCPQFRDRQFYGSGNEVSGTGVLSWLAIIYIYILSSENILQLMNWCSIFDFVCFGVLVTSSKRMLCRRLGIPLSWWPWWRGARNLDVSHIAVYCDRLIGAVCVNVPKGSSVVVAKLVSTPEYELPAEADQGKRGFVLNLFFRYNLSRPLHISEVRLQQLTQSRP